jgi:hypothetical protein
VQLISSHLPRANAAMKAGFSDQGQGDEGKHVEVTMAGRLLAARHPPARWVHAAISTRHAWQHAGPQSQAWVRAVGFWLGHWC